MHVAFGQADHTEAPEQRAFDQAAFLMTLVLPQAMLNIMHSLTNGSLPEMLKDTCADHRVGMVMVDPPSTTDRLLGWSQLPADAVIQIFQACCRAFRPEVETGTNSDVDMSGSSNEAAPAPSHLQPGDWAFFSYLPHRCHWPPHGLDPSICIADFPAAGQPASEHVIFVWCILRTDGW
ncbi:hypothetical protein MMC29_000182 [Sticta canariensis]|nr:hypothetical protein [Sticta canariensis]